MKTFQVDTGDGLIHVIHAVFFEGVDGDYFFYDDSKVGERRMLSGYVSSPKSIIEAPKSIAETGKLSTTSNHNDMKRDNTKMLEAVASLVINHGTGELRKDFKLYMEDLK
jgi:hypothetical protein